MSLPIGTRVTFKDPAEWMSRPGAVYVIDKCVSVNPSTYGTDTAYWLKRENDPRELCYGYPTQDELIVLDEPEGR
jgi:hypothetical protein